jgi:hypothetical protein
MPFVGIGSDPVPGLGIDADLLESGEETLGVACRGDSGIGDDERPLGSQLAQERREVG